MQVKLKRKSEAKLNWAVTAYNDWREERLWTFQYDVPIYYADLNNLAELTKPNLQHALCRFVPEVTKKKGEGLYLGQTLYQMIVGIQKYLFLNKLKWKLIDGEEFDDLRNVLDNVMKHRTEANVGVVKKQAQVISYEQENLLWERGILGEQTPDQLRRTVLFLLGINMYLRAVDEHYNLRRSTPDLKESDIIWTWNSKNQKCMVYREDSCTKTHDGGLNDMHRERKEVWVFPSSDTKRCPVRWLWNICLCVPK